MKTDSQIQEDVLAELRWDPKVNATHIGVEVKSGVVTLSGHVDSFGEKWDAEEAAKRVSGVKALAIELKVNLPNPTQKSDSEIAQSVANALQMSVHKLDRFVKIMVEDGFVTLSGVVEWQFQKEVAANTIRYLQGVKGIYNKITIKPKISVTTVKSDIDAAFNRRARIDSQTIKVQIQGSEVILGGKVHDWSEKNLAIDTAWSVPGVSKVTDNMTFA